MQRADENVGGSVGKGNPGAMAPGLKQKKREMPD
jgi:hypothetical protein